MSYILDALKKSEAERQHQQSPGFAATPGQSKARQTPTWIWLLAGLLLINAAVLATLLLRPAAQSSAGNVVIPASTPAEDTSSANFADIVRDARQRTPATEPEPAVAEPEPAVASNRTPLRPEARPEPSQTPPPAVVTPAPAPSRSALPSYLELSANGELQLPPLHLDIHVHSPTASERFVFINMSKYRENDRLSEGPRVIEITSDGVILEEGSRTFLLSRD